MVINVDLNRIFLLIFWIMYISFIFISNRKYKEDQNMENMEKRAIFTIILGASAFVATNFFLNRGKIIGASIGAKATVQLLLAVSLIIFLIGISIFIYIFIKKIKGE